MSIVFSTVFVASLLGSLHCVGMCGPFALLAGANARSQSAAIIPTVAYSLGRLITYSIMGLIFGGIGMAINRGTGFNEFQQNATYIAGGLMIGVGVVALLRCFGYQIRFPAFASPLQRSIQSLFQRTIKLPPLPRALVIGMLTTLMPCGWLYAFGISAAGTGSPLGGMALMMVFWAGTVPIMAALMLGVGHFGHRLQARLPVIMAVLVLFLGIFTCFYRAPIDLSEMTRQASVSADAEGLLEQIRSVDHVDLPCCSER